MASSEEKPAGAAVVAFLRFKASVDTGTTTRALAEATLRATEQLVLGPPSPRMNKVCNKSERSDKILMLTRRATAESLLVTPLSFAVIQHDAVINNNLIKVMYVAPMLPPPTPPPPPPHLPIQTGAVERTVVAFANAPGSIWTLKGQFSRTTDVRSTSRPPTQPRFAVVSVRSVLLSPAPTIQFWYVVVSMDDGCVFSLNSPQKPNFTVRQNLFSCLMGTFVHIFG